MRPRETGDAESAAHRHGPLPHDARHAGAPRRLDGARRDLRPRDRQVSCGSRRTRVCAPTALGPAGWPGRCTATARCYALTGDAEFLAVAERNADFWLTHLPKDHVPYWDFAADLAAPLPWGPQKDSSAAAIAASGLLDLERQTTVARSRRGLSADGAGHARRTGRARVSGHRHARLGGHSEARRLSHGQELGVDESVMWGEYFFVEALGKAMTAAAPGPPPDNCLQAPAMLERSGQATDDRLYSRRCNPRRATRPNRISGGRFDTVELLRAAESDGRFAVCGCANRRHGRFAGLGKSRLRTSLARIAANSIRGNRCSISSWSTPWSSLARPTRIAAPSSCAN